MTRLQMNTNNSYYIARIVFVLLLVGVWAQKASQPKYLNDVLVGVLREKFAPFLDNVLKQVPSRRFFRMIDQIHKRYNPQSDAEWYAYILDYISDIKPFLGKYTPWYRLFALRHQRKVLSEQLKSLITVEQAAGVATCIEIGKPATYVASIREFLPNLKRVIAINYSKGPADYVEGFSLVSPFKPYHQFISLNDYEPITADLNNSVDLIICTIGLHHVPIEKLDAFVASIRSVLKPGGIFILRDHDVADQDVLKLAHGAHSIFNAVLAEESLEGELQEYRNFQSLSYWIELLRHHDFDVSDERILQYGDPSMNTLIKATARPQGSDEYESMVAHCLSQRPGHYRDIMQTYLTTPEWVSVDISQEYSNFVNHTPFYEFPWIQTVFSFWKAFYGSWRVAVKKRGLLPAISSPYMVMNIFIGTTLTVEHIIKAVISAPIRYMYSGAESETLQALVYDPDNEIMNLHPEIKTLELFDQGLKLIEVPRYKQFLNAMLRLVTTRSLEFRSIGGQKEIVCKIRSANNSHRTISNDIPGSVVAFEWTIPTQQSYTYAGITIPVHALKQCIELMIRQGNELLYVHDF